MILMENSPNPPTESRELTSEECATKHIVLDEAKALLPIRCDDERAFDAGLADLSLLEHGTLEPQVELVTLTPPLALAYDDDVSLIGRRHDVPERCGLMGAILSDMSLLETPSRSTNAAPNSQG
jgi:hypothetical protein